MKILENKVSIITGASRGLGKVTATLFAQEGARVVLAARTRQDIEQIAAGLVSQGYAAVTFPCDVSDPLQIEALANFAIHTYGHFDVWVNNAGVAGPYGATLDLTPEQFLSVLRTNMFGVYYGSSMAMRHFLPRKSGKLINILAQAQRSRLPTRMPTVRPKPGSGFLRSHWQPKPKTAGWASSRFSPA